MHNNHSQVSPEVESNAMSQPSTSPNIASDQLRVHTLPSITAIVWKEIAEQRKPRRRSLDSMLDDNIARDQRNREEIVRATLLQVN